MASARTTESTSTGYFEKIGTGFSSKAPRGNDSEWIQKTNSLDTALDEEERVFDQLLQTSAASGKKASHSQAKADVKARVALETWKSAFFSMVHTLKQSIKKKQEIETLHPWLCSEKEATAKLAKYKGDRYRKGDGPLEDSDSSDLDLESVPTVNKSTDARTIKCLHSRLLLFMARQLRHLNEHLVVIEKLDISLKHTEQLSRAQNAFANMPPTSVSLPLGTDEKNPLWRALGPLALVDREKFIAYCKDYIERCALQSQPTSPVSATESKRSRSPMPACVPMSSTQSSFPPVFVDHADADSSDPRDHLSAIESGNKHIDSQLQGVSLGVSHLKTIAVDMRREVDEQNTLLPVVHGKVDMVDIQLEAAQGKVQRALAMVNHQPSSSATAPTSIVVVLMATGSFDALATTRPRAGLYLSMPRLDRAFGLAVLGGL